MCRHLTVVRKSDGWKVSTALIHEGEDLRGSAMRSIGLTLAVGSHCVLASLFCRFQLPRLRIET